MRIDWLEVFLIGFLALMIFLLGLFCYALYQESEECHKKGGKMVETGETTTIITYANNVPIITTYDETECSR